MRFWIALSIVALATPSAHAWNATGHETVAAIAWENMTPNARRNVVALLQKAPPDACLLDLFPNDSRPLAARQREFFIEVAKWADIVRPGDDDDRPCTRFHERDWHFVDYFWEGVSGSTSNPPEARDDLEVAAVNAVERLGYFRPLAACDTDACGTPDEVRATTLAWIVHLVGDIHQPLHTSGHVTGRKDEQDGDEGGNSFKLGPKLSLHSYWDGIVNRSVRRLPQEQNDDLAYVTRVAQQIAQAHPRASLANAIEPGEFEAWSEESLDVAQNTAYPRELKRNQVPDDTYRQSAFAASERAIALAGYRLADLLNEMFD